MAANAEPAAPDPGEALQTTHLSVPRTARIVTAGVLPARARRIWYGLHGYGQSAHGFARDLLPLAAADHLVVPEALSRFYLRSEGGRVGASWMTREDRESEIADYVGYLDAVHRHVPPPPGTPIGLLGFSQGAATACRWAAYGAAHLELVVLWGGGVPPDLDWDRAGDRLRALRFMLITGTSDPYMPPDAVERSADLLRSHGIKPEVVWFAGGHHLSSGVLKGLA